MAGCRGVGARLGREAAYQRDVVGKVVGQADDGQMSVDWAGGARVGAWAIE